MLHWLEFSPVARWVNESWGWPFALTLHAFGSAVIVGFSFILLLRLSGTFKSIPVHSFRRLIPFVLSSLLLQTFSGFLLWLTSPSRYVSETTFESKMALVVIGFLTTIYLQRKLNSENYSRRTLFIIITTAVLLCAVPILSLSRPRISCIYAGPGCAAPSVLWMLFLSLFVLTIVMGLVARLSRQVESSDR
jgi:hypothetical protein